MDGPDLASDGLACREEKPASPVCALALIAAQAFSLGLAAGFLAIGPDLTARFITANDLPGEARHLLMKLAGGAALAAVLGAVLLWRRSGAHRLWGAAWRSSPLLLSGLIPALFNWRAWVGRDLQFLLLAAALALASEALFRASLASTPFGVGRGWGRRRVALATLRPLPLVCLAALAYAAYFSYHTIAFHRNVFSRSFDLGLEANAVWNAAHGGAFLKSSPFSGPQGSLLGHHAVFFAYAIAPLYALHGHPETLLALQAALIGAAPIFLFLWGRRHLDERWAGLAVGCYFLYPPLHGANLYGFHYQSLAPFFLWLTMWAVEARRDRLAVLGVLATLALREDVAASLIVIGLYFLASGERPKAGALIAGVGAVYFAVLKFVIMPAVESDPSFLYAFAGLLPAGTRSFEAVLLTVVGNPVFTFGTLLTAPKLTYALQILVPLAFLPLRTPLAWLLLLPGFFFTLLSTSYPPFIQTSFQYTSHWTGFIFPALVLSLARLGRPFPVHDRPSGRRLGAAALALAAVTLVCSHQEGAILQHHTARSGFDPFRFGTTDADRARRAELYGLIARIPPLAKVAGSETVVPHISSRPDAYTLRLGLYDAEHLLFSMVPTSEGELEKAAAALASGEFGIVEARSLFALARRGQETSRNPEVLARMAPFMAFSRNSRGAAGAPPGCATEH